MATQVSAVTGIPLRQRFRRPSSNYILDLFAEKEAAQQRERELAATEQYRQQQLNLAEKAYEQGKERDITGTAIAGLGLGTQALLAYDRGRDVDRYYGRDTTAPSSSRTDTNVPWHRQAGTSLYENYLPILLSGAGGAAVGTAAGKKRWQQAAIGGAAGGVMGYLGSGGDPYAAGASAVLGGGGAALIDLLS